MADNPYLSTVTNIFGDDGDSDLRSSLAEAMATNPETAAKALPYAMQKKIPLDMAERNLQELESDSRFNAIDFKRIQKETPMLSDFLRDRENAKLAHDDIGFLEGVHKTVMDIPKAIEQGDLDVQLGTLRDKQLRGIATPEDITRADELSKRPREDDIGTGGFFSDMVTGVAGQIPILAEVGKQSMTGGFIGAGTMAVAGQLGPQVATPEELVTVPAGFAAGSMVGAFNASRSIEAGLAYDEFLKTSDTMGNPMDPDVARGAATIVGLANGALELLPLQKLVSTFGGSKISQYFTKDGIKEALKYPSVRTAMGDIGKKYAELILTEGATEMGQEAITMYAGEIAKLVDGGEFESPTAMDQAGRIAEAGKQGMTVATGLGGIGSGISTGRVIAARNKQPDPQSVVEYLKNAKKTLADSGGKLPTRSLEKMRDYLSRVTENKDLYLDGKAVQTFYQSLSPEDQEAIDIRMPGFTKRMNEAVQTNGDMALSRADYMVYVQPKDTKDYLDEHARMVPEHFSAADVVEYDEFMGEAYQGMQGAEDGEIVANNIYTQLLQKFGNRTGASGRVDVARMISENPAAFYETMLEYEGPQAKPILDRLIRDLEVQRMVPASVAAGFKTTEFDLMIDRARNQALGKGGKAAKPSTPMMDYIKKRGGVTKDSRIAGELKAIGITPKTHPKLFKKATPKAGGLLGEDMQGDASGLADLDNIPVDELEGSLGASGVFRRDADLNGYADRNQILEILRAESFGASPIVTPEQSAIDAEDAYMDDLMRTIDMAGVDLTKASNAQIKLALQELMDQQERDNGGETFNQFAGPQSSTADIHALANAKDRIAAGEDAETVRKETGWFRGPDEKWRYEISDEDAKFNTGETVSPETVAAEIADKVKVEPFDGMYKATWGENTDYMGAYGKTEDEARQSLYRTVAKKRTPKHIFNPDDVSIGMEYALADILSHDKLFAAYPDLKMISVDFDDKMEASGQVNHYGSQMTLNPTKFATHEQMLSTIIHEVQHLIQRREGFARGGNLEMTQGVKSALEKLVETKEGQAKDYELYNQSLFRDAAEARRMVGYANMFQDFNRLIDYSKMDRPSGVFRHIRNATQWFYTPLIQENETLRQDARELERSLYALPRSGAKRNAFLREFSFGVAQLLRDAVPADRWEMLKKDPRKTNSMIKAFERESAKASAKLKPHYELKKDARLAKDQLEASRYRSPFEIYQLLAGEVEARNTQNRASMTDAERREKSPAETMTAEKFTEEEGAGFFKKTRIFNEDVIVVMQSGEIDTPFIANIEPSDQTSNTESEAFKEWFGDSKVVDENGKPLVVYKGMYPYDWTQETPDSKGPEVESINRTTEFPAFNAGEEGVKIAGFFGSKETASRFAEGQSGAVYPVYLNISKPFEIDAKGDFAANVQFGEGGAEFREAVRSGNYDGVIIKNTRDEGDIFVAFEPTQIKSVHNRGTFDKNDARILYQSAYHGSPHRFDKFTLDHIGTGEGAQAYGWGLYFAGKKEVAEYYREALTLGKMRIDGKDFVPANYAITEIVAKGKGDKEKTISDLRAYVEKYAPENSPRKAENPYANRQDAQKIIDAIESGTFENDNGSGQLYEVKIPEDDVLLLWDKPLSEQSEAVQNALKNIGVTDKSPDLVDGMPLTGDTTLAVEEDEIGTQKYFMVTKDGTRFKLYKSDIENLVGLPDQEALGKAVYQQLVAKLGSDKSASLALNDAGVKGIKYLDGSSRTAGDGSFNYVIFDDSAIETIQTFYQGGGQDPRGSIQFTATGRAIMRLYEKENLSTVLHELGHLYWRAMTELAQLPSASDRLKTDVDTMRAWVGAKPLAESTEPLTVEQEEKIADGFLAYIREGNAPSVDLQNAFSRMKAWMLRIYRGIKDTLPSITPEVKDVFDRMLATDDAIEAVKNTPLFELDAAITELLPKADAKRMQKKMERAVEEAKARLLKQALRQAEKKNTAVYREARAALETEIGEMIDSEPVYKAMAAIKSGGGLARAALVKRWGKEIIPRMSGFGGLVAKKGGTDPDFAANVAGYDNGDQMVMAIINAKPRKEELNRRVDDAMLERFGDLLNDGTLEREAVDQMHNALRAEVLQMELDIMAELAGMPAPTKQGIEAKAIQIMAESQVKDISPTRRLRAEKKALFDYGKALGKKDYTKAARAKAQQLLNHHLYEMSTAAQKSIDKSFTKWRRYRKTDKKIAASRAMDTDYVNAIRAVLARYDIMVGGNGIFNDMSYEDWIERVREENPDAADTLEALIRNATGLSNAAASQRMSGSRSLTTPAWKNMSWVDFQDLQNAIDGMDELGRDALDMEIGGQKVTAKEAAQMVADVITENNKGKDLSKYYEDMMSKTKEFISGFDREIVRMEFILKALEGNKINGKIAQIMFNPIVEADGREVAMVRDVSEKLKVILEANPNVQGRWNEKVFDEATGKGFTIKNIVTIALNMGNESNLDKMLRGHEWSLADVQRLVFKNLRKEDMDTVQAIWDLLESLRPDLERAHKKITRFRMKVIAPRELETPWGTYKGGYFPIVADPKRSAIGARNAENSVFESNFTIPSVGKGMTKERTSVARELLLDFEGILPNHIGKTIHLITHGPAVADINRIIMQPVLEKAIKETAGVETYQQFKPWLTAVARNSVYDAPVSKIDKILRHLRVATSTTFLGFSTATMAKQILGLSTTLAAVTRGELTMDNFLTGMLKYFGDLTNAPDFVMARSAEMPGRIRKMNADMATVMAETGRTKNLRGKIMHVGMAGIGYVQMYMVDMPTWMAGYEAGLERHDGDQRQASLYADALVRQTQGAGAVKDLAQIQRGSEAQKTIGTMFGTYILGVLYPRLREVGVDVTSGKAARGALTLLPLLVLPALLEGLISDPPDDDEDWLKWLMLKTAVSGTSSIPLVGGVAKAAMDGRDYQATAVESPINMVIGGLSSDDPDKFMKGLVVGVGLTTQLPVYKPYQILSEAYDQASGEEEFAPGEIFLGRRDVK